LITRILVPVDFSEASRNAACYARALARRTGARLSLLHVVDPVSFDYSMVGASEEVMRELSQARAAHARRAIDTLVDSASAVNRELSEGDPATEILQRIESDETDLLVMSTRGAGAVKRVLGVGSVTLHVLASAECPVLTALDFGPRLLVDKGVILCGLDLGPSAARTLQWAATAAREFEARLVVVHATTFGHKKMFEIMGDEWHRTLRIGLEQHFRELLEQAGVAAEVVIGDGSPHAVVAETARTLDAGWVVIGRSASRDVKDRLRAHCYDIIRRSPCPVVSV
jgi:nucleotide-binding universal stress UspA family protein